MAGGVLELPSTKPDNIIYTVPKSVSLNNGGHKL